MAANQTRYFFEYKGQLMSARDLIDSLGRGWEGRVAREMSSRLIRFIKNHGIDKAMDLMSKAESPVTKEVYLSAPPLRFNDKAKLDNFDKYLLLKTTIKSMRKRGYKDPEIFIKLKNSAVLEAARL